MIFWICIGIIVATGVTVTWWVEKTDRLEREESAAAYKELYEQLLEKQKS